MQQMIINYVVQKERAGENIDLIRQVFKQLHEQGIQGVKYAAYKMGENVFVHIAQFENEEANKLFSALPAFRSFRRHISDRLEEAPIVNDVQEIGSYASPV